MSETARSVCGTCQCCREGRYNLCEGRLGFGALYEGAMADFFVTRQEILHRIPDTVAALTEPYCVAYNAVVERARVRPGDAVTVIGPGPVGVFAAQVALLCGACEVAVVGIPGDGPRLDLAAHLGATATVVAAEADWWARPEYESRLDVVVDASGASSTLAAALAVVKPGGQVVKVGWGPDVHAHPLDTLVAKAVELHGSFSHTWGTWERVLTLLGKGRLRPGATLVSFDLYDWEKAFFSMSDRQALKTVLTVGRPSPAEEER